MILQKSAILENGVIDFNNHKDYKIGRKEILRPNEEYKFFLEKKKEKKTVYLKCPQLSKEG